MKVQSVILNNVKSFKEETTVNFTKDLNILIGPNAGGKSNLLEILQGIINDLIFLNVNIRKNTEPLSHKQPYKFENLQSNRNNLNTDVIDKYFGNESQPQKIVLKLLIESNDIANIETVKSNKDLFLNFESQHFIGTTIKDYLNTIDFNLDFSVLTGHTLEVVIENQSLSEPNDIEGKPFRQFYNFFRYSNVFANFIRLVNTDSNSHIEFKPYFLYISPHRNPINLSQLENVIDLVSGDQYDSSFFKQVNQTQSTQSDMWTLLLRRLVENKHDGNIADNDFFRDLLGKILKLDFSISKVGPEKRSIMYAIKFFRKSGTGSPKLSSGEKEFLNLITSVYVHQINGGVILMDEPELHLHPRLQKELLEYYLTLSNQKNLQIILVTHSTHLIVPQVLKNVIRIYSKDQVSTVSLPELSKLNEDTTKKTFKIVHATNNEKMFFADKVVLVEGDTDRIIYQAVLKKVQSELGNKEVIEVLDVLGKNNFDRYKSFLEIWNIPYSIIADNDYISDVATSDIKSLFATSLKKARETIENKHSKDGIALLNSLETLIQKDISAITIEDFNSLKSLWAHIKSRHLRLPDVLNAEQKSKVITFIESLYPSKTYILKDGEIEDYFQLTKDSDIQTIIDKAAAIEQGNFAVPVEIQTVMTKILA